MNHTHWMQHALELAQRGAGYVSPNPLVGAVLVSPEGEILGEGWHERFGGPHAEVRAIEVAERAHGPEALRSATLYVNLEPCAHYGKTPPCSLFILQKGIPRVVVGMQDPFPAVAGRGMAMLRAQGVEVIEGVLRETCEELNAAFVHHVQTGFPYVTVKMATTLDGRVATRTGDARWITGREARTRVHALRAASDAILTGSGTARRDNPALTVRHVEGPQPLRIVLDRRGTLPPTLKLLTDAHATHTLVVTAEGVVPPYAEALHAQGGRLWQIPEEGGKLHLRVLLQRLGKEGRPDGRPVQSLLVEAGPTLVTELLRQGLVQRYLQFIAPRLLGEGLSVTGDLGIEHMREAQGFVRTRWEQVGNDLLFTGFFPSPA